MQGTQWKKRSRDAERVTEQAWDNLVSAVESANESAHKAKKRARHLTDGATDRLGAVADEAGHRARAAYNALAGKRQRRSWGMLVGLTAAGLVAGWLGAMAARRAQLAIADTAAEVEDRLRSETLSGRRTA